MTFRKSSYSGGSSSSCVEIGDAANGVLIRDTKQAHRADRTTLAVSSVAWTRFISAVKQ
jgi:hypothetical protein